MEVYSGEGALGGRCSCGAVFVLDETGRSGGQALMDAQTLACDGDLDRALKLDPKRDLEVKTKMIREQISRSGPSLPGHSYLQPKVWAIKLKDS